MIIDAHHHLWDVNRRDYEWLAPDVLAPLRRPYTVDDLWEVTDGRVAQTVLVQTVSDLGESAEFLAIAGANGGLIRGVVGWVDLAAADVVDQIDALREGPGGARLVGIRHQVQDEPDPEWLSRPEVLRGLRAVGAAGLAYDLLVLIPHLEVATAVVRRLPEVRFVLDHLAKPGIATGAWEPWATRIAELAAEPNVSAKLSGLVTEARWDDWDAARISPYAKYALEVFGPHRLMYGSDWPVCTLAASYEEVWDLAGELVAGLSEAERDAVLGGTAARFYGL